MDNVDVDNVEVEVEVVVGGVVVVVVGGSCVGVQFGSLQQRLQLRI